MKILLLWLLLLAVEAESRAYSRVAIKSAGGCGMRKRYPGAADFISNEMNLYRISFEVDTIYPATFLFFDEDGNEVEKVAFHNLTTEEIHQVLRQRGFLPMKE
eukprot:TRINITY_DN1415_c0_g1_i4.p2 TRINITY_DN1415_c0_g1~~TRINITY_DN1415_c0_g1_i4.p2  ORF type:complete len:103 (+),score=8.38 TRINITY_DN1415_c0_g1_i4:118-426(+)